MSQFEGQLPEQQGESAEALKEMGSLPVTLVRTIDSGFNAIHTPKAERSVKLQALLMVALSAWLLAACGSWAGKDPFYQHGPTGSAAQVELPPVGAYDVGETGSASAYAAEQEQAHAAAIAQVSGQQVPSAESPATKEYQPAYAVVQPGESVIAALRRAAGAEPHQIAPEQIIEILHSGDPSTPADDWVEVYTWPALLRLNPRVDAGDQINDTLTAELSVAYPVAAENRHIE